jgi:predicted RNase H-like HicB family nuclease
MRDEEDDRMSVNDSLSARVAAGESITYAAVFTPGEDGWICAQLAEVPEAISQGRTIEEAKANVTEALEGAIAWRLAEGEPVPRPAQVTVGPVTVTRS